ncbi:MAG: hypothetical protein WCJ35_28765, partial [Planctomycetota bacterium]
LLWPVSDRATPPTEGLQFPGDLRSGVSAGSETRAERPLHRPTRISTFYYKPASPVRKLTHPNGVAS